jgi:proteasome alpha subunit
VLGGETESIAERLEERWTEGSSLAEALRAAVDALAGPDRTLGGAELEVAVLSGGNGRRAFRRLVDAELEELLA